MSFRGFLHVSKSKHHQRQSADVEQSSRCFSVLLTSAPPPVVSCFQGPQTHIQKPQQKDGLASHQKATTARPHTVCCVSVLISELLAMFLLECCLKKQ